MNDGVSTNWFLRMSNNGNVKLIVIFVAIMLSFWEARFGLFGDDHRFTRSEASRLATKAEAEAISNRLRALEQTRASMRSELDGIRDTLKIQSEVLAERLRVIELKLDRLIWDRQAARKKQ